MIVIPGISGIPALFAISRMLGTHGMIGIPGISEIMI